MKESADEQAPFFSFDGHNVVGAMASGQKHERIPVPARAVRCGLWRSLHPTEIHDPHCASSDLKAGEHDLVIGGDTDSWRQPMSPATLATNAMRSPFGETSGSHCTEALSASVCDRPLTGSHAISDDRSRRFACASRAAPTGR